MRTFAIIAVTPKEAVRGCRLSAPDGRRRHARELVSIGTRERQPMLVKVTINVAKMDRPLETPAPPPGFLFAECRY